MVTDKNLFMYDLAVVAIMKNEGPYIKEWLDYHLLAGVNHFYIYDNESPDNQKEILQPYIEKGLVDYIFYPGKARQYEAYNEAVKNFRFLCRYMAFIDGDEFILPQKNQSIVEVLDEILSENPKAGGLAINWHQFGSNHLEKADLSRGVLERFTRRASDSNIWINPKNNLPAGNALVKLIANPRKIDYFFNPHFAIFLDYAFPVNEKGEQVTFFHNNPPTVEKIVLNHYPMKSREEYEQKISRGAADGVYNVYQDHPFDHYYNDEFDDKILKYRELRKKILMPTLPKKISFDLENFPVETDAELRMRILGALSKNLLVGDPSNLPEEFFEDKMETFLTSLIISEKLEVTIQDKPLVMYALFWIRQLLTKKNTLADYLLIYNTLPDIIKYQGTLVDVIRKMCIDLIPIVINYLRTHYSNDNRQYYWQKISDLQTLKRFLTIIK